ncbi:calpain-B-like isoform X2 [Tubulanus polymorphus]|uniref:calpain-B-like isoform X2 n=1 Tax=Tubulanus polymorphus TaxID=672921 RepID=UPI003DA377F1
MSREQDRSYKELLAELLESGQLFEDADFPAKSFSIDRKNPPHDVQWMRPWEIFEQPLFINHSVSRFDLDQGELGDCWFVSATSLFAMSQPAMFERVVPKDQTFERGKYAGIFRFNFWRFGKWTEVVVDDRLPTKNGRLIYCQNTNQPNEMWGPLIEKAYAKIHGSYQAINGGFIQDALVDFTGGLSEVINMKDKSKLPENMDSLLMKTLRMNSMLGSSIAKASLTVPGEVLLPNGLYAGHAYSITGMATVTDNAGERTRLIRCRNPWGRGEYKGAFSDSSTAWDSIPDEEKEKLHLVDREDGEFWMPFEDWKESFTSCEMVHLSPDAIMGVIDDEDRETWGKSVYHGRWVRGVSAGGCGNKPYQRLLWINPQYALLGEPEAAQDDGKCTFIVSLMEKNRGQFEETSIGFQVFKVRNDTPRVINQDNFSDYVLRRAAMSNAYTNLRETTNRFELDPGRYIIIPTTFAPGKEAEFLLRIFTEKETPKTNEIDEETGPTDPREKDESNLTELFQKYAGGDHLIDARELKQVLNDLYATGGDEERQFGVEASRSMLAMMDTDRSGQIDYEEFVQMITEINVWKGVFDTYDRESNGSIDVYELAKCFKRIGFPVSRRILIPIVKRYGGKDMIMTFEDFVLASTRLRCMFGAFMKHTVGGIRGRTQIDLETWLESTLYC